MEVSKGSAVCCNVGVSPNWTEIRYSVQFFIQSNSLFRLITGGGGWGKRPFELISIYA